MKRILICIDDSLYSLKAANKGILLAKGLNAEISLIYVIDPRSIHIRKEPSTNVVVEKVKKDADVLLNKIINMFSCSARMIIVDGNPNERIIEKAREYLIDLIVLGAHGRTGLTKIFMGSTATEVVRNSKIPVLIVPFKAIERSEC